MERKWAARDIADWWRETSDTAGKLLVRGEGGGGDSLGTSLIGGEKRVAGGGWHFLLEDCPPPLHTHTSRAGDTFSAAKNIDIAYIWENITNIDHKFYLNIIHIVCQLVIRPECGFLRVQFCYVGSFFCSQFCQKQKTSKCGNMEKYMNIIYSVSFPTKQRTYGVHI